MNYDIFLSGKYYDVFDTIIKLLIVSAEESDYDVKVFSFMPETLHSPLKLHIKLNGSLKKESKTIIVDFDNLFINKGADFYVSPDSLDINLDSSKIHYWHIFGNIFQKVQDISPAFVTGFLLEKDLKEELAVFRNYLIEV